MIILSQIEQIDRTQWNTLVKESTTATWFQTPEAYDFYVSLPDIFSPFVVVVQRKDRFMGLCVGYITKEKNLIKQFFSRRAIIIGGPLIAKDIADEELLALLTEIKRQLRRKVIYIETRNFNDYSHWRSLFEQCGFKYQPHYDMQIDTHQSWMEIENSIGKHRKKYIRLSYRDGIEVELHPSIEQVREYYKLLQHLYCEKIKLPLYPWSFFEHLYYVPSCHYFLVHYAERVIGGSICMSLEKHGIYEWFACGKDGVYKNIHPSSVTKYIGIKFAADNNYPIFDMMGAGKPEEEYGVRDFKAEFGGQLVEYGRFFYSCSPLLFVIGKIGVKLLKKI